MYDDRWPIRTYHPNFPPPKFVFAAEGPDARRGQALDSIVCQGCIVSGGQVERSIIGSNVRINSFAHVQDSILFEGVDIGRHARSPPGDHRQGGPDSARRLGRFRLGGRSARGFTVSDNGITVIAKADGVEHFQEMESLER